LVSGCSLAGVLPVVPIVPACGLCGSPSSLVLPGRSWIVDPGIVAPLELEPAPFCAPLVELLFASLILRSTFGGWITLFAGRDDRSELEPLLLL
jgi:hypothetical protein